MNLQDSLIAKKIFGGGGSTPTGITNIKCGIFDCTTPVTRGSATIVTVEELGFIPNIFILEFQGDPMAYENIIISSVMFTPNAFGVDTEKLTGLKSIEYRSGSGSSYVSSVTNPESSSLYQLCIDSSGNIKQITQNGYTQLSGIYKWIAIKI